MIPFSVGSSFYLIDSNKIPLADSALSRFALISLRTYAEEASASAVPMNTSTPESLRFFSSPQMIDLLQVPINAVPSHQSSPGTTSEEASGADKTAPPQQSESWGSGVASPLKGIYLEADCMSHINTNKAFELAVGLHDVLPDLEETGEVRQKSALNSNSFPYPFIRLISLLELPRN